MSDNQDDVFSLFDEVINVHSVISDDNDDSISLVNENVESASTDVIMDLKTGIYNLFVRLFHNYIPEYGPEQSIRLSTEFLEEIIFNFRHSISEDKN